MEEQQKELQYVICKIKNGIFEIKFKDNLHISLEMAKQITLEAREFSKAAYYTVVAEFSGIRYLNKDARQYWGSSEGFFHVNALAFVVTSFLHRLIANIFITFEKPKSPCKIFAEYDEAIEWLQQYKGIPEDEKITNQKKK
jgi:hypothetical protein